MRKSLKDAITMLHHELRGEFTPKGSSLVYITPTDELIGVTLDGSSHNPATFYIWIYWLPLYAPTKYLYFNFGKRIRREKGELWCVERLQSLSALEAVVDEIMRWKTWCLDRVNRLDLLNAQFANLNMHAGRALFYDLLLHRDFSKALEVVDTLSSHRWTKEWQIEILRELTECVSLIQNPEKIDRHLAAIVQASKSTLNIL